MPSYPGAVPSYPGTGPSYPGAGPSYPGAGPSYPGQFSSQPGASASHGSLPSNPAFAGSQPGMAGQAGLPPASLRGSQPGQPAQSQPTGSAPAAMPGQTPDAGLTLPRQFGKYTLVRQLAVGGMAELYLAIQRAMAGFEKLVVIKRILPQFTKDGAFVQMLIHEARIAATLDHPNICQTFDVGENDGTYFIAMEHINGEDIRSIVRGMRKASLVEFPLEHALNIVMGTCSGLGYAHDKRNLDGSHLEVVHRDISPQNVLVTFTGDVKVVDFGIAKSVEVAAGEQTHAGQLKGKVPYMSPEQAAGREIDHRSDIFSVGIVLFELTTGRRLFKAPSDYETLKLICEREYPRPSQVKAGYPPQLERIVMKALEKDRDRRYQTARDMLADLEEFVRQERIAVSKVGLAAWMKLLFAEKIAQSKETLQDLKQLADQVHTQHEADEAMYGSTATGRTASATVASQSGMDLARQKKSRVAIVASAIVAVAVAIAVIVVATRPSSSTASAETGTSATAALATASAPAEATKGKVTIESKPTGCDIWLNGELQKDVTPATLELPFDREVEIKLTKKDHVSYVEAVTLSASHTSHGISAELDIGSVTLVLKVTPPPRVWLDGKPVLVVGDKIEGLAAGDHKVTLSAVGFAPQTFTFTVKKGDVKTIDTQLRKDPNADKVATTTTTGSPPPSATAPKATGNLAVAAKGGYCNVSVNGRGFGPTPVAGIVLPEGPVSVSCKTPDGKTLASGAQIVAGQTARVSFNLN